MQTTNQYQRLHSCGHNSKLSSPPTHTIDTDGKNRLTGFNVAIAVLVTFILLVKVVMFILHIWYPLLGTVTNIIVVVLWAVSVYGQAGPDYSDPAHPSRIAWYINKSCDYARPSGNYHYCLMAKGTFAITVFMLYVPIQTPL
jgi:hypothetical protein